VINCKLTTPGSTIAYRSRTLISWTLFMRVSAIITPPPTGSVPPARLVPAPRGTNGTSSSLHSFTIADTCSAVVGNATTDGRFLAIVKASHS